MTMKQISSWGYWTGLQRVVCLMTLHHADCYCYTRSLLVDPGGKIDLRPWHVCNLDDPEVDFRRSFYRVALVGTAKTPSRSKAITTSSAHLQVEHPKRDTWLARFQGFARHCI